MICSYCQKEFNSRRKKQKFCSTGCNARYQSRKLERKELRVLKDHDWLFDQYWVKKRSMRDISRELGCAESWVYLAMDKLGITRRTISKSNLGKKKSLEHRMNLSKAVRGRWRGKNNPNYKGGITRKTLEPRFRAEYIAWRRQVKRKYNNTCVKCKKKLGTECKHCGEVSKAYTHHIKSVKDFPELATKLENGILLCYKCHRDEHTLKKTG